MVRSPSWSIVGRAFRRIESNDSSQASDVTGGAVDEIAVVPDQAVDELDLRSKPNLARGPPWVGDVAFGTGAQIDDDGRGQTQTDRTISPNSATEIACPLPTLQVRIWIRRATHRHVDRSNGVTYVDEVSQLSGPEHVSGGLARRSQNRAQLHSTVR